MRVSLSLLRGAVLALLAASVATPSAAECAPWDRSRPRTLVLAIDGVPFRVMEQARADGAFEGWPATSRMVSTFPSVTNVCFTMMFGAYGVEPARGYEVRYFDKERNGFIGGTPIGYKDRSFSWRGYFDIVGAGIGSKLALYTNPGKKAVKEMEYIEQGVLESRMELVFAHIGSTDVLQHLKGDEPTLEFLIKFDTWLAGLKRKHVEKFGEPLRVVLLSDHGNSYRKIYAVNGIQDRLRKHGLNTETQLEQPGDVVASSFGVLGFGAVFTYPEDAERTARALNGHEAIDLLAWRSGLEEISVIYRKRFARIVWSRESGALRVAYKTERGDPLLLNQARSEMASLGLIDEQGFADDRDWFRYSATGKFPDAMRRLIDVFTGKHVYNQATVFFSLKGGWGWGWKSAHVGSWLRGGYMEGTHGAIDADSSLGFFLSEDLTLYPGPAVRAGDVFLPFLDAWHRSHCTDDGQNVAGAEPETTQDSATVSGTQD